MNLNHNVTYLIIMSSGWIQLLFIHLERGQVFACGFQGRVVCSEPKTRSDQYAARYFHQATLPAHVTIPKQHMGSLVKGIKTDLHFKACKVVVVLACRFCPSCVVLWHEVVLQYTHAVWGKKRGVYLWISLWWLARITMKLRNNCDWV